MMMMMMMMIYIMRQYELLFITDSSCQSKALYTSK